MSSENPYQYAIAEVTNKWHFAEQAYELQPYFYDELGFFWIWDFDRHCYKRIDENGLLKTLMQLTPYKLWVVRGSQKAESLNALRVFGRGKIPKDVTDQWVQFGQWVHNPIAGSCEMATPSHFFTSPLPYEPSESEDTPFLDKLFLEWVYDGSEASKQYVQTLYEIMAYCCLRVQPAQRIFALTGMGANGKSTFQAILQKFIGIDNVVHSSLDQLAANRFETAILYQKLACLIGEVNSEDVQDTKILKSLTGDTTIRYEFKNKMPFTGPVTATIVIATNSLPAPPDKSYAYYRRWLVIDFPNTFGLKRDVLAEIPEQEWHNLSCKCVRLAKKIMETKEFTGEGSIQERIMKYESRADPINHFLKEECTDDYDGKIEHNEFNHRIMDYLKKHNHRPMSKSMISKAMKREGFVKERRMIDGVSSHWFFGIRWKDQGVAEQEDEQPVAVEEVVHHHCFKCNATPCSGFTKEGKPICKECDMP